MESLKEDNRTLKEDSLKNNKNMEALKEDLNKNIESMKEDHLDLNRNMESLKEDLHTCLLYTSRCV